MTPFRLLSAPEQVAEHLRREMRRGIITGEMPGSDLQAVELHIGRKTAEQALRILEKEGLLVSRKMGCRRQIAPVATRRFKSPTIGPSCKRRHYV